MEKMSNGGGEAYEVPVWHCANCGYKLDHARQVLGSKPPTPGCLSMCLRCGQWLRFNSRLHPYSIGRAEINQMPSRELKVMAVLASKRLEVIVNVHGGYLPW